MTRRVLVDANVLVSRTTLDWLHFLRESNEGMFQLHVTHDIQAEAIHALRRSHPRKEGGAIRDRVEKISGMMDEVLADFSGVLDFTGTDEHDYHVHAAAVAGRADLVLTYNAPSDITTTPDLEHYDVISPDDFFILVTDSNPHCLLPLVKIQFDYWSKKPGHAQLDDALRKAGCPEFAQRVRQTLGRLA
ncbi:hypothetical protein HMPREF2863_08405 [Micrococcus sp. HMSC067E09]|uniref:PIN domain-containing protein n=1 Tax=Micrococcus lylae TaxID=1273 RepID=A0ABY2JZG9_9MICC|nr:hypothetical protein HMPREF2863_08405 [Micrococcus sp. HMSC067E09]TFH99261.1 PIN domain-containing protein [Micrococcus lylae]